MEGLVNIWCQAHWQPVLESQDSPIPINPLLATAFLFGELLRDERFIALCGDGAEVSFIESNLKQVCPVCCWLQPEALRDVYDQASMVESGKA